MLAIAHRVTYDGTYRAVLDNRDAHLAWGSVQHRAVGGRSVPPMTVVTALIGGGRTHPGMRGATLTNRGSEAREL